MEKIKMIYLYKRGHKIIFTNNKWIYEDNKELANYDRVCKRCGRMPTKEGYDACLGKIEGVKFSCCGHGILKKYILRGRE